VTMQLQLGPTSVGLQDGLETWNGSAADALGLWNRQLGTVRLSWVANSTAPRGQNDGRNSAFFSNTVFGETFGEDILAVTVWWSTASDHSITREADVIFNTAFHLNSCRGPLQHDQSGNVYDFHRIALHEFGHVLGLDHPDDYHQGVPALMNSVYSDLDHLVQDDIDGVKFLYEARITSSQFGAGNQLEPFVFQVTANNGPLSYSATGLPPGLQIDVGTGIIRGVCPTSGVFDSVVEAHGKFADASRVMQIGIGSIIPKDQWVAGFELPGQLLADPIRPRMYVATNSGISVIDTTTLSLVRQISPGGLSIQDLSISADRSSLWFIKTGEHSVSRMNLQTYQLLPDVPVANDIFKIREGLDNRLYVSTFGGGVLQVDAITGITQQAFSPTDPSLPPAYAIIELSPDRRTLFVGDANISPAALASYDVSTVPPLLIQRTIRLGHAGHYIEVAHNGQSLCFITEGGNGPGPDRTSLTFRIPVTNLDVVLGSFQTGPSPGRLAFNPNDSIAYQSAFFNWRVDAFDTHTFALKRSIHLGQADAYDLAVDKNDKFLFVTASESPGLSDRRFYSRRHSADESYHSGNWSFAKSRGRSRSIARSIARIAWR
jgi:DNA-binding beta-propeller fold protein YncE